MVTQRGNNLDFETVLSERVGKTGLVTTETDGVRTLVGLFGCPSDLSENWCSTIARSTDTSSIRAVGLSELGTVGDTRTDLDNREIELERIVTDNRKCQGVSDIDLVS